MKSNWKTLTLMTHQRIHRTYWLKCLDLQNISISWHYPFKEGLCWKEPKTHTAQKLGFGHTDKTYPTGFIDIKIHRFLNPSDTNLRVNRSPSHLSAFSTYSLSKICDLKKNFKKRFCNGKTACYTVLCKLSVEQ